MSKSDFVVFLGIAWFILVYCASKAFRASLENERWPEVDYR